MNQYSKIEKVKLFRTLFKGRVDVFAIYWEKGKKKGYKPAYQYDPNLLRLHLYKGGTFNDYKDKTLLPLTDQQVIKHLKGEHLIGLYPLLTDNSSWLIAADFDGDKWAEDCLNFINICKEKKIAAYFERSRSGKGGHVWIFFDHPYPAFKSRKILNALLTQANIISIFDKNTSFDRLFPNQDYHSGKGFGNLIALPLHKPALEQWNSCFIDEQLRPHPDQWDFLSSVKRVSVSHLDRIYETLQGTPASASTPTRQHLDKLLIKLDHSVHLNRTGITPGLIDFLNENLNLSNTEYFIKKKTGKSTWGTKQYFKLLEENENEILIPRGFIGKLLRYCNNQKINYEFLDKRDKKESINFSTNLSLRSHQEKAIKASEQKDFGIITSPSGSGKTVIGLKIIAEKRQPALIVVHRKQLLEQWIERTEAFLGITKKEIGRIGAGKARPGKAVTIATFQSLGKYIDKQESTEFIRSFGTIIIDECHHIPAETFRATISKLSPYYQYGLTATPFRKGNEGKIIFIHLGEVIAEIKEQEIEKYKKARIIIRETSLDVPFNSKTDPFEILSKVLVHDSARNKLILDDVKAELNKGYKAVIITERREHIGTLYQFLKQSYETVTLSGEDSQNSRQAKWKILNEGNYQALITTGQFFGEGSDLQNISRLFLVFPFSFKGKLIQYIGRVQRSEITPVIYDYRDSKIDYLDRLFLKRNTYYKRFERNATLFDEQESNVESLMGIQTIEKTVKIPIDDLDFRYGAIALKISVPEHPGELEFEIENDDIRPEFDVLKPYFAKTLKLKAIPINIYAEFRNKKLISQIATSEKLEQINREIIESAKFRFLEKSIIAKQYSSGREKSLLDLNKVQEGAAGIYSYDTEEELLNDLLKNENVIHYRHLRYLASKHEGSVLKIRFVLSPFSFVFLLSGQEQYHIILETLDTEEATYIWHIEKSREGLFEELGSIDQDLNTIRNLGRKYFLENHPENFNRIIHDYSEARKGFVLWKDLLEERLV